MIIYIKNATTNVKNAQKKEMKLFYYIYVASNFTKMIIIIAPNVKIIIYLLMNQIFHLIIVIQNVINYTILMKIINILVSNIALLNMIN